MPKLTKACAAAITGNTIDLLQGERDYLQYHLHDTPALRTMLLALSNAENAVVEFRQKELEVDQVRQG